MLDEFLARNRDELISRCRAKVATRPAPRPTETELQYGIPLFVTQLTAALRLAGTQGPAAAGTASCALSTMQATRGISDIRLRAAKHGNELLLKGLTVDQVVHDYGDLCQAVTAMAVEQGAPVSAD